MERFYQQVVAAAARAGVPCVIVGAKDDDGPPWDDIDPQHEREGTEAETDYDEDEVVEQLQGQVQQLTQQISTLREENAALRSAPAAAPAGGGEATTTPTNGEWAAQPIDVLGLEEKLTRKLTRLGHTTVGLVSGHFADGYYASQEAKIKKDWQVAIGMACCHAQRGEPAGAVTTAPAPAVVGVPEGHSDRPWVERLSVARGKQQSLDRLRRELAEKQQEARDYHADNPDEELPEELDEILIDLETKIELAQAQLITLRWCLGLDPDVAIDLDESLRRANLANYCEDPQPRLLPDGNGGD